MFCDRRIARIGDPRRRALYLIFTFFLAAKCVAETSSPVGTNSPFEQFKAFIASPPVIEHLVVRKKLSPAPGMSTGINDLSRSQRYAYYEARWQPGAVFYRDLPSLDALTNFTVGRNLVANFGADDWLYDSMPWIEHWVDEPQATDRDNDVTVVTRFRLPPLWEVLNLGVQHLEPAKIRWTGNRFAASSPAAPGVEAFDVTGELIAGSNGLPSSMNLIYKWQGHQASWITRYRYERPLELSFLPNRIEQYWTGHGGVELGEYEILDLKVESVPLLAEAFSFQPFRVANHWQVRLFTNKASYEVLPSGELKFLEYRDRTKRPAFLHSHARPAFGLAYVMLAGFNLWIFRLAMRTKRFDKNKQITNNDERQFYEKQAHTC
jgi:hypothetical protein